jgi:hypothetical protein
MLDGTSDVVECYNNTAGFPTECGATPLGHTS